MKLTDFFKTKTFTEKVKAEAEKQAQEIIKEKGLLTPDEIKEKYVDKAEYEQLQQTATQHEKTIADFEIDISTEVIDPVKQTGDELTEQI